MIEDDFDEPRKIVSKIISVTLPIAEGKIEKLRRPVILTFNVPHVSYFFNITNETDPEFLKFGSGSAT